MNTRSKFTLLMGGSLLALAGCGGGGSDSGGIPPTPPVIVIPGQGTLENMFGAGFGAMFRASANSDPTEPKDLDLIGLTLTEDAVPVP